MIARSPPIGLLPAAGRGTRFGASGYAKELFPLLFEGDADGELELRPICELALLAIQAAGAERCVTAVSREKVELLRVLGQGLEVGMALAYVVQPEPRGLPDVIRCARAWLGDNDVLLAMPDTVFLPSSALAKVHARRIETDRDLMLGVFPVDEPGRLGPVDIGPDGSVRRVYDKPGDTPHRNTWGVASWSARFTSFCYEWAEREDRERPRKELILGHVFEAARVEGLSVGAVFFEEGRFIDIGTPRGLRAALAALATQGVLIADQAAVGRETRKP